MDKNIIIASHHESGHALMAYIVGWSINSITLVIENDELDHGVTKYDYCGNEINNTTNLNRRVLCLLGGPIAQAIYEKNNKIDIDLLGQDGITIDKLFSNIDTQIKGNRIQEAINTTATLLNIPENKKAIELLVKHLIENHKISQTEFIAIVNSCKVLRIFN